MDAERLLERTELRRALVSQQLNAEHRALWGQFFTPPHVAEFLASLVEIPTEGEFRVLDPGAGVGSLSAAIAARAITARAGCSIHVVAYEAEALLAPALKRTLHDCERAARAAGVLLTTEIRCRDFLSKAAELTAPGRAGTESFDACVMNPPYRKISTSSDERAALERIGVRVTKRDMHDPEPPREGADRGSLRPAAPASRGMLRSRTVARFRPLRVPGPACSGAVGAQAARSPSLITIARGRFRAVNHRYTVGRYDFHVMTDPFLPYHRTTKEP